MSSISRAFNSSIGRKMVMGLTGVFLITFLLVHCFVNSLIFLNNGGETFDVGAHFMGTNWFIRGTEVILMLGILIHAYQGYNLTIQNRKARPIPYAAYNGNANSKWYSRSMGLLGTLILMFLIVHLNDFWVVSRFGVLPTVGEIKHESLYNLMWTKFQQPWRVVLYALCMISLCYHLLHGFASAFQTLGIRHRKWTPIIQTTGVWFSIIISVLFALMPIAVYTGIIHK